MNRDPIEARAGAIAQSRLRSAVRIAGCLRNFGCDAPAARDLDETGRRQAEAVAGVRPGRSAQTWELVSLLLEEFGDDLAAGRRSG